MKILFPYKLQLHIFQLDEYSPRQFLIWVFSHFFVRKVENKKPLVLTAKARLIYFLSLALAVIVLLILTFLWGLTGLIAGLVLSTQAYVFLLLSYSIVLPFETYKKNRIETAAWQKIKTFSSLKVIGITGSYGKTSTKEFLYQILKSKYKVLKTPESYNTTQGIAKVIDLELDTNYKYFICEMGAYKIGEIKKICAMVNPQFGILTGINQQHIDTFGTLENIIKGKFELIDFLPDNGFAVVNIDNKLIKENSEKYDKKIVPYGFSDKKFSITDIKQTLHGSEFLLLLDGKKYKANTSLLGNSNLQNILAASTMSYLLGVSASQIISAIQDIEPVPHRLQIKRTENLTLIDDAYNSNVDGFKEAIALLKTFNSPKVFVTPGIVNLGKDTTPIHAGLGKLLNNIDFIILVGESDRTKGLKMGIQNKKTVIEINSIKELWKTLDKLKLKNPVVLLENDLPDNY
jgi:UDP-N-acetylmuramoyl-tripeptide--D-alanyl-D-alanine ligase